MERATNSQQDAASIRRRGDPRGDRSRITDALGRCRFVRVGLSLGVRLSIAMLVIGGGVPTVRAWDDAAPAETKEGRARVGRLVRIPLPITGEVDTRVKNTIRRVLEKLPTEGPRPVLVLEFFIKPGSEAAAQSDFHRAYSLAEFLSSREVNKARTVAYLPQSIQGHAVLAAMACEEIYMAPDATIGEAGIHETHIDQARRDAYRRIQERFRTIPLAIALGMLDKETSVLRVETDGGVEFVLETELEKLRKEKLVKTATVVVVKGQMGRFTAAEGRTHGFVKRLAGNRAAVATALELPPSDLVEDPSLGGHWKPISVSLHGPINGAAVQRASRIISEQVAGGANFVCLRIESDGGYPLHSVDLANFLAQLNPGDVRTVAYIAKQARGDAALVAMACDHIVMHRDAVLGGPGGGQLSAEQVHDIRTGPGPRIALGKSRSWSLLVALVDPEMEVHRFTRRGEQNLLVDYFCAEEWEQLPDHDQWQRQGIVKSAGAPLEADGNAARQLGLASQLVNSFDEFKQAYGLEQDPPEIRQGWALELVEALAQPGFAWLLLLVGFGAMYIEMQAPGVGIGGFVSGVCFLLYFWSQFLHGTAEWLEALLFVAGLVCLLLEIFLVPGFGILGLGGAALMLASVVLATQTFVVPHNEYQQEQFRNSLLIVAGAVVGVLALAVLLRRYLPHAPFLGRVVLQPPVGEALQQLQERESLVDLAFLVGQRGTTATQLKPAGVARFGDEMIHVQSDGDIIPRGVEVIAVEAHGSRVVVRQAEP